MYLRFGYNVFAPKGPPLLFLLFEDSITGLQSEKVSPFDFVGTVRFSIFFRIAFFFYFQRETLKPRSPTFVL